jgi:hypothetical protein
MGGNTRRRWLFAGVTVGGVMATLVAVALGLVVGSGTAARAAPPTNTSPPTITGTPVQGEDLTAHTGGWSKNVSSFAYRWGRCDKNGSACANIGGATGQVYTVKNSDVGHTLRVRLTASNPTGSTSAASAPTAVITAKPPATGCPPGNKPVSVNLVSPPARLTLDQFSVDPTPVHKSTSSITLHVHVSNTCHQSVSGALVYAAVVPFNQFSVTEQPTDANGVATLVETRLKGFPAATHQQLLTIFLRARKPGEDVLTGISNRRLVSVKLSG